MIPVTPRGFKDVLPKEARIREKLRRSAQDVFDLWGYDPIETPALEVLDVLQEGSNIDSATFRLFDADNKLLVLRPDVTLPIARMVATRLPSADEPHRFRYDMSVFRDNESSKGKSREFTQLGIEQIGVAGYAADAETIVIMIESLLACGLKDFKIEFCNVKVLSMLLDACEMDDAFRKDVQSAYHSSNYVALDNIVDSAKNGGYSNKALPDELAQCLKNLIRIHGGKESIEKCSKMLSKHVEASVFDELLATWNIVEQCGYQNYIGVDFSLLSSFDYYTGIIFEAFVQGFGKSIGGGGRYDGLLQVFGKNLPAAGFAFSLEYLMHALATSAALDLEPACKNPIDGDVCEAFAKAMQQHAQGQVASLGNLR